MQVKRLDPLVIELREVQDGIKDFLLLSDVHFDHPYCDRKMFFRLMDQAKAKNAKVFFNGDFFCMMQARGDKRGAKNSVRPEHQGANYFDLVINEAAELLKPYAENIELLGDGNHETAIQKWNEINPLDRLASIIKYETGHQIHRAGYHGFIKLVYHRKNSQIRSLLLYHHHGKYGGDVTMGALGVKRHAAIIPDADIIWTGHTHDLWHIAHPRLSVAGNGRVTTRIQHHVKTGTFKDEFNVPGGFGVERLNKPAAIGGYWMRVELSADADRNISARFQVANDF
jgi:hypothetical protein